VRLIGYSEDFNIKAQWPIFNEVNYCGEEIKDREDCDEDSKKPDTSKGFAANICFTPH
jgi:hypothetical protein